MDNFEVTSASNKLSIGKNIIMNGYIKGENNTVIIEDCDNSSKLNLTISGNNNKLIIKNAVAIKGLTIRIGNHIATNDVSVFIDKGFSIEGGGRFLLDNHKNILTIGKNCLFSNTITLRCGDSPHLIFDSITGEYLDKTDGIFIGEHVWVGEKVYITKKCSIADESVVASCSVVTKRFTKKNTVLAGNPAKEVRENVQWIRNKKFLEKDSIFYKGYETYLDEITKEN